MSKKLEKLKTQAACRAVSGGPTCAVCGQPKDNHRPLCRRCMSNLDQRTKNLLVTGPEEFRETVEMLRIERAAKSAGFRIANGS